MDQKIQIAVGQMTSVDNIEENYHKILRLIDKAFEVGNPRLILFPENCLYFRIQEGSDIPSFDLSMQIFRRFENVAVEKDVYIHLGSVPMTVDGKVFNASVLVTPEGNTCVTYHKIHLFDIELKDSKPIRESDVFSAGRTTSTFMVDGFKFGESICYDIRFSELYSQYARAGVDVILIPSAFLVKTGKAHWEVLNRARAVENQCYVVSAAQGGLHESEFGSKRTTYGHSMVVGPWGDIEFEADESSEGIHLVTLEKQKVVEVRAQIPMKDHRRL